MSYMLAKFLAPDPTEGYGLFVGSGGALEWAPVSVTAGGDAEGQIQRRSSGGTLEADGLLYFDHDDTPAAETALLHLATANGSPLTMYMGLEQWAADAMIDTNADYLKVKFGGTTLLDIGGRLAVWNAPLGLYDTNDGGLVDMQYIGDRFDMLVDSVTIMSADPTAWGVFGEMAGQSSFLGDLDDSTGGTPGLTLTAVGDTSAGDESETINDNFASLAAQVNAVNQILVLFGFEASI